MRSKVTAYLAIILMMAGSASAQRLPVGAWHLASYNFNGKPAIPLENTVTLIVRSGGKLGGTTGCNSYGGKYMLDHGKLKIGDLIQTMMYCDESSNQFEAQYTSTLRAATRISRADGQLTLTDPKTGNFLRFEKAKTVEK